MRLSIQIEFDKILDLETNKISVIVGRSPQCDLVIPHDAISRQHCKIDFRKGQFYITDLDSSNGVSIDGQRIRPQERVPFLISQQLKLGTMECEINESHSTNSDHKVVSSTVAPRGDFTSTIRISRIDLNKPSLTLEQEKKPKIKGPRNPVTAQDDIIIEHSKTGKYLLIAIFFILIALAWHFFPSDWKFI